MKRNLVCGSGPDADLQFKVSRMDTGNDADALGADKYRRDCFLFYTSWRLNKHLQFNAEFSVYIAVLSSSSDRCEAMLLAATLPCMSVWCWKILVCVYCLKLLAVLLSLK